MARISLLLFLLAISCNLSLAQDTLIIDITKVDKVITGIGKISMKPVEKGDFNAIAIILIKYKPDQAGYDISFVNNKGMRSIKLPEHGKLNTKVFPVQKGIITELDNFQLGNGFRIQFYPKNSVIRSRYFINPKTAPANDLRAYSPDNNSESEFKSTGVTGIPYYDALTLCSESNFIEKLNILTYYAELNPESTGELKDRYKENPFMAKYVDDFLEQSVLGDTKLLRSEVLPLKLHQGSATAMLSSNALGSADITTLADGFAKFLVVRVKTELSVAFFDRLKTLLNDKKYEDMQTLFPQTFTTLSALGEQIYDYSAYLNTLRESFEMDLNSLLTHLPLVINKEKYQSFFDARPKVKALCLSSIYIGQSLIDKKQPGEIIRNYDISLLNTPQLKDVSGIIELFKLLSESMRSVGTDHYWISLDSAKLLLHSSTAAELYLGLLFQQGANIQFSNGSLKTLLNQAFTDAGGTLNVQKVSDVKTYVSNFANQVSIVTKYQKELKTKSSGKLVFTDFYNYYNSVLTLMDSLVSVDRLFPLTNLKPLAELKKSLTAFHTGGNIAMDINRRNYSSAIVNSFQLYLLISKDAKTDEKHPDISGTATTNGNALLKYGSFIAALAQAQNSDEAEKAIESAALPPGSSAQKRHSCFDISLNAYTGIFCGYEWISSQDHTTNFNAYGVAAPIGVAFSTSSGGWSLSLFGSFIDLGAIAAFRFANDQLSEMPTVQLKDIVSPGAFLSIGIPGCPISVNAGWQKGPNLRTVKSGNADLSDKTYTRFSVALSVDTPIFSLYNKKDE